MGAKIQISLHLADLDMYNESVTSALWTLHDSATNEVHEFEFYGVISKKIVKSTFIGSSGNLWT